MGYDDSFRIPVSDTQAYKQFGNSVAVPVFAEGGPADATAYSGADGRAGSAQKLADVHDPATRSRNMAAIRGRDTKPELIIRKGLHACGFRFRLQGRDPPGRPDPDLPEATSAALGAWLLLARP